MPLQQVRIEATGFNELAEQFAKFPGAVHKAERKALVRTMDWAKTQGKRGLAARSNVQGAKLVKARRILSEVKNSEAKLFLGTNPVKARYLGKLSEPKGRTYVTAQGARGTHKFEGAFVAEMRSGYVSVFKRRPSAWMATGIDSKGRPRKNRLPIDEQEVPVQLTAAEFQAIVDKSGAQLVDEFGHMLRYYSGTLDSAPR